VRQLEQIKDLYLTAEAIGEENLDKHFDQLMAQQRALISQYFKQPASGQPDAAGDVPEGRADPGQPGTAADQGGGPGPAHPAQGAGVAAEQPRAW
jgi:hypothetical protein